MNNDSITRDKNDSVHDNMINDLAEIDVTRFNTENTQHHITSVSAVTTPTTTTTTLNVQIVNSSGLDSGILENACLEVPDHVADEIIKASGEFCEENITISDEQLDEMTKVCRFCLAKRDDMRLIFEHGSCIPDVIMMITNIQIQQDDGFPVQICFQCILYASRAFAFKQQVEAADESLKNFIGQGFGSTTLQPIEIHDEFIFQSISGAKITEEGDIADFNTVDELDEHEATIHVGEDEEVIIVDFENTDNINEDGNKSISSSVDGSIMINEDQLNSELLGEALYCDNSSEEHLIDLPSDSESICSRVSNKVEDEGSEDNNNSKSQNEDDNRNEAGDDQNVSNKRLLRVTHSTVIQNESSEEDSEEEEDMQCDNSNNNICKICEKVFKTQEKLIRHAKAKHNRRAKRKLSKEVEDSDITSFEAKILPEDKTIYPYTCSVCKQGFNIENDLKIHYSLHVNNNGKHICLHCKKECTTYLQLKRHVRTHYEDKPYKCRICRKGFPEMGSLTRHFRRHTGEQREKKHLCNTCGKGYYDSHALIIHSRTHTGERPWVCNICGKSFIDSRLLNSHLKVHSGKKPHSCEICKKSFTHHSTLTTHLRTHTGEKPYVCSVCGKTFIQSSNLSLHMRVHSGEKPYKCIVCDRRFASSSTLTMHMRIHTGEKPYSCKMCGKKFARHDLSAHIRTHTGEKPFACQCGKKFTTTGQLNQHALTHTGVKRYICSVCQKRCSSSTYLKKHMKSHAQAQQNANKHKIVSNVETGKTNLDTVLQLKYTKLGPNSQHNGCEEDSDNENLDKKCDENVDHKSDDNDEKGVTLDNAILQINSTDLLNVVQGSSNVAIQVPVLSASDLQSNLGNVYSSFDGKYIYQAIDPTVIRIKREGGNHHLSDGNTVNTIEMSR